MTRRVVLSLEQAVALPYATLRFVQLGWRVIRIEPTSSDGRRPGDPNRYAGEVFADEGRRSFFVPPNVGKEAIALNLKSREGQDVFRRLLAALDVEIFCCNVLPAHHAALGVDYETLARLRPDLIWASISAMGTEHPDVPGYDPVIQAMSGLMSVSGFADGPPVMSGVQITDLKAGDELYANSLLALVERAETGRGKRIDVSMLQAAASWLVTMLPNIDIGTDPSHYTRSGNFHRIFVPTGVYEARDGHIYLAIGNTQQWRSLVTQPPFARLDEGGRWDALPARAADRQHLWTAISEIIGALPVAELVALFVKARIPHALINSIEQVHALPAIRARMPRTHTPDGRPIWLAPMAVDQAAAPSVLEFAPRYGQHTDQILREVGLSTAEISALRASGVAG